MYINLIWTATISTSLFFFLLSLDYRRIINMNHLKNLIHFSILHRRNPSFIYDSATEIQTAITLYKHMRVKTESK